MAGQSDVVRQISRQLLHRATLRFLYLCKNELDVNRVIICDVCRAEGDKPRNARRRRVFLLNGLIRAHARMLCRPTDSLVDVLGGTDGEY